MNKLISACRGFLQDAEGHFSHARLIAVLVGLSATVFMWLLTINDALTIEYFMAYLAYGVVHQSVNKFLDVAGAWLGLRRDK